MTRRISSHLLDYCLQRVKSTQRGKVFYFIDFTTHVFNKKCLDHFVPRDVINFFHIYENYRGQIVLGKLQKNIILGIITMYVTVEKFEIKTN